MTFLTAFLDFLIGADGGHSRVRDQYCPDLKLVDLDKHYVAGLLPLPDATHIPKISSIISHSTVRVLSNDGHAFLFMKYKGRSIRSISYNT